jgi:hypothetical protein
MPLPPHKRPGIPISLSNGTLTRYFTYILNPLPDSRRGTRKSEILEPISGCFKIGAGPYNPYIFCIQKVCFISAFPGCLFPAYSAYILLMQLICCLCCLFIAYATYLLLFLAAYFLLICSALESPWAHFGNKVRTHFLLYLLLFLAPYFLLICGVCCLFCLFAACLLLVYCLFCSFAAYSGPQARQQRPGVAMGAGQVHFH